jgi:hypothetical protein
MLTDGLRDLIAYTNENKYTKVVRVLNVIKDKFNIIVDDLDKFKTEDRTVDKSESNKMEGLRS